MKALFDENLSPELVNRLADVFPESVTVLRLSPRPISDARIWQHARSNGYFILTKDDDFERLAMLRGHPPKVVWLRCHNCTNEEAEQFIRAHLHRIQIFLADTEAALLVLP